MTTAGTRALWPRWTPGKTGGLAGLIAGVIILGPALLPGYVLIYDMVFVPEPNFGTRTLGLDGSVPRAVPNDLVVSLLSVVLPGWVVQKFLLLVVFLTVGAGVGAMLRTRLGAVAAALAACWNPYVAERLAIGHWAFLLGYALLPWVALAAVAVLRSEPGARSRMSLWLVLAAASGSTSALMAAVTAGVALLLPLIGESAPSRGVRLGGLATLTVVTILANAAWWLPAVLFPGSLPADPWGVPAFASRADTPFGLWGSLVTGGGIWNEALWPPERGSALLSGIALLATGLCVGVLLRRWRRNHPAIPGLVVVGVLGLLLAAAGSPVLADMTTVFVVNVPGGGLIRDGQKFLAPWMLVVSVAVGTAVERVWCATRSQFRGEPVARHTAFVLCAAVAAWPVATMPSLAFGSGGDWAPADYPANFLVNADRINEVGETTVAVFPWTLYRRYEWNHGVVVLDPWSRLLRSRVLVNDDLPLSTRSVRGEDPAARRITSAVAQGDAADVATALRDEDVRFVVFQRDQPTSAEEEAFFDGERRLWSDARLVVYDLGPADPPASPLPPWAWLGLLVAALTALTVLGAHAYARLLPLRHDVGREALPWSTEGKDLM
jgi:hypothetical protein